MSWQRDFDESGPRWETNAAAIAAEKWYERKLKEENEKEKKPKQHIPQHVFNHLDEKMKQLKEEENEWFQLLDRLDHITEEEKNLIKSEILIIRKQFL